MKTTNLGRAPVLQRVLRALLAGSALGTIAVGTIVACGDTVDLDGYPDCEIERPEKDAGACATFTLRIESDPAKCPARPNSSQCDEICGTQATCSVSGSVVTCRNEIDCMVDGRRPDGLAPLPDRTGHEHDLGAHFAAMAYHEAAAAFAFAQLALDLRVHGAPKGLLAALRRAGDDERRHAELATRMARRHRCEPSAASVAAQPARSLFAIALENAREGCGRELLGAAVGLHIAEHAADADIRALFARVAEDEVRHAAVSLRMQRWIRARLTADERRCVDGAMRDALLGATTRELPRALTAPNDARMAQIGAALQRPLLTYLDRAA